MRVLSRLYIAVSVIEAIQSQLKNIYTNTLSTLCPLPWLEEAGDVQYNFDNVFIPLRTIDIHIQQDINDRSGPSERRDGQVYGQAENMPGLSDVSNMRTHHTRYQCDNYNL